MKTKVINVNREHFYVYDNNYIYIGRPSIFGNPYELNMGKIIKDGSQEEVISKFRDYFYLRMSNDTKFRDAVMQLKGKILGCFCRPKKGFQGQLLCHGQIIAGYLDNIPPQSVI